MAAKTQARRGGKDRLAETIVDAALEQAEEAGWDGVRLHQVAENMGKWPSGHGQLTKVRLSDGCGGKTITTAA